MSAYYEYCAGIAPDQRYGDNCVRQALLLGDLLVSEGFEIRYLRDGRHLALLCEASGSTYYVDPYLMPLRPVPLFGPGIQALSFTVPAFPLCTDHMGRLTHAVLRVGHCPVRRKMFVRYSRFASRLGSHAQSRAFEFSLDDPCHGIDLGFEDLQLLLFHREQNNLSIRAIDPRDFSMIEVIYPFGDGFDDGEVGPERLVVRWNADRVVSWTDTRFRRYVDKLARSLDSTYGEVVDYVLEGVRTYKRHMPPGISHSPYDAEVLRPADSSRTDVLIGEGHPDSDKR